MLGVKCFLSTRTHTATHTHTSTHGLKSDVNVNANVAVALPLAAAAASAAAVDGHVHVHVSCPCPCPGPCREGALRANKNLLCQLNVRKMAGNAPRCHSPAAEAAETAAASVSSRSYSLMLSLARTHLINHARMTTLLTSSSVSVWCVRVCMCVCMCGVCGVCCICIDDNYMSATATPDDGADDYGAPAGYRTICTKCRHCFSSVSSLSFICPCVHPCSPSQSVCLSLCPRSTVTLRTPHINKPFGRAITNGLPFVSASQSTAINHPRPPSHSCLIVTRAAGL